MPDQYQPVCTIRMAGIVPADAVTEITLADGQTISRSGNDLISASFASPTTAGLFAVDAVFNDPAAIGAKVGQQIGITRDAEVVGVLVVATDKDGDRVSDTFTVELSKVSSAGAETSLGSVAVVASSYEYDTTLSGWTTDIADGDAIKIKVTGVPATAVRISTTVALQG